MQPYIKLTHTRVVLHPSSDLFNGKAWLALIVGCCWHLNWYSY
jgi:hypothetical protein